MFHQRKVHGLEGGKRSIAKNSTEIADPSHFLLSEYLQADIHSQYVLCNSILHLCGSCPVCQTQNETIRQRFLPADTLLGRQRSAAEFASLLFLEVACVDVISSTLLHSFQHEADEGRVGQPEFLGGSVPESFATRGLFHKSTMLPW